MSHNDCCFPQKEPPTAVGLRPTDLRLRIHSLFENLTRYSPPPSIPAQLVVLRKHIVISPTHPLSSNKNKRHLPNSLISHLSLNVKTPVWKAGGHFSLPRKALHYPLMRKPPAPNFNVPPTHPHYLSPKQSTVGNKPYYPRPNPPNLQNQRNSAAT
jgi:hypothetical protein